MLFWAQIMLVAEGFLWSLNLAKLWKCWFGKWVPFSFIDYLLPAKLACVVVFRTLRRLFVGFVLSSLEQRRNYCNFGAQHNEFCYCIYYPAHVLCLIFVTCVSVLFQCAIHGDRWELSCYSFIFYVYLTFLFSNNFIFFVVYISFDTVSCRYFLIVLICLRVSTPKNRNNNQDMTLGGTSMTSLACKFSYQKYTSKKITSIHPLCFIQKTKANQYCTEHETLGINVKEESGLINWRLRFYICSL